MTVKSMIADYADFNVWANQAYAEWLAGKPHELMERELPSSFPNIKTTMLHIWGAEEIWLCRLKQLPIPAFLTQRFDGSIEEVFKGWPDMSKEFAAYVHDLPEDKFEEECEFRLLNGTEDRRPRIHMLHHCLNHSTYHRGQIVTMARNLGIVDPPATDFIRYIRIKNS